jgi:hypothetical protein
MARQFIGEKKLQRCREIGGQNYEYATVRGGDPHFVAICEWSDDGVTSNSDLINYRTGKFLGAITRNGGWVKNNAVHEVQKAMESDHDS